MRMMTPTPLIPVLRPALLACLLACAPWLNAAQEPAPEEPQGSASAREVNADRLWLPASAANLRPFLVMAVNKVLEDPSCVEVLYARLNEYRTIYEEPTFTVLCQKDPKTTFNRVVKITEVDPEYFEKLRASADASNQAQTLNPEIEALRRQLLGGGSAPADTNAEAPADSAPQSPAAPADSAAGTP
jgi:hypothetical protein